MPLDATFSGDGRNLSIILSSNPSVTWSGVALTAHAVNLTGYRIGTGRLQPFPATGALLGTQLVITGMDGLPFDYCALGRGCTSDEVCPFQGYNGDFDQVVDTTHPPPTRNEVPMPQVRP